MFEKKILCSISASWAFSFYKPILLYSQSKSNFLIKFLCVLNDIYVTKRFWTVTEHYNHLGVLKKHWCLGLQFYRFLFNWSGEELGITILNLIPPDDSTMQSVLRITVSYYQCFNLSYHETVYTIIKGQR